MKAARAAGGLWTDDPTEWCSLEATQVLGNVPVKPATQAALIEKKHTVCFVVLLRQK